MPDTPLPPIRVWDLPTRAFHWLLATAVFGCLATGFIGGGAMVWHFRFGYGVLALVVFRLLWGLVGGRWSRFASFIYAPATTLRYLRGQTGPHERLDIGHSPTGALSVFALLALLALQVSTGLVADDEIANIGPLNKFVSGGTAGQATSYHTEIGVWVLITLIVLHIAAIVYYRVKKQTDLVRPMLVGDKPLPEGTPASADALPQRLLAVALLALCLGLVWWVSLQAG